MASQRKALTLENARKNNAEVLAFPAMEHHEKNNEKLNSLLLIILLNIARYRPMEIFCKFVYIGEKLRRFTYSTPIRDHSFLTLYFVTSRSIYIHIKRSTGYQKPLFPFSFSMSLHRVSWILSIVPFFGCPILAPLFVSHNSSLVARRSGTHGTNDSVPCPQPILHMAGQRKRLSTAVLIGTPRPLLRPGPWQSTLYIIYKVSDSILLTFLMIRHDG